MNLLLPPKSLIRGDEPTVQYVHNQLTSVIAGHAQATTTYRFYEELDNWLGPWGKKGYPIAYGKFYNIAFTTNRNLKANPTTERWVWRTTVLLQEALRDYVVSRVRHRSIMSLTEQELRQAAFDSHARAYDDAGLAMVALTAPELIPIILSIPRKEFSPNSSNYHASKKQVSETLRLVAPQVFGVALVAATTGPAHNGMFHGAIQKGQYHFLKRRAISDELGSLKQLISQRELDYIPCLNQIIAQLHVRQFPDQGFARLAREVIQVAQERKRKLVNDYDQLLRQSPEVQARVYQICPNLVR